MQPKEVQIKEYLYDLPEDRIAKYPLPERASSKLLIYKEGEIKEDVYSSAADWIPEKSMLVFNDTKVVQARLRFKNSNGANIEIFCLEPSDDCPEPATAMAQHRSVTWTCLVGRATKWKEKSLLLSHNDLEIIAEMIEKKGSVYTIEFSWFPEELSFAEVLHQIGEIPIPPYLKRESEESDLTRYQTVYAQHEGSVAAPTAGLHFNDKLIENMRSKGVYIDYVTLHVGAGTFKPVKTKTIGEHEMHAELIDVNILLIEALIAQLSEESEPQNIIAVGTTSLRTLESLYWMGVKAFANPDIGLSELEIEQWEAYELEQDVKPADALQALHQWMMTHQLFRLICKTQIMIVPPYKLRVANAIFSNFHQPSSTLLLLIAAVIGKDWKAVYNYALENDFRFLSYGDGSLLWGRLR